MVLFAILTAAALADDPPISREVDPRFLPQSSTTLPEGALRAQDPITHPF